MTVPDELAVAGRPEETRRRPPALLYKALRSDIWLTGTMFVVLTTVTFLGVIMRYFINRPFTWLEEMQIALFLGVVYLGGGAAFRHGSHVAIDFLVDRLPAAVQRIVLICVHVIVVGVLAYFAFQSAGLAATMAKTGRVTSILRIPSVIIYAMIPIGLVWTIINYLYTVVCGEEPDELEVIN